MRSADLVVVVVVVVVVAWAEWARGTVVFLKEREAGACGNGFLATHALSDMVCAVKCTQKASCVGFSFVKDTPTSSVICQFHESVTAPDGNPDATCFVLRDPKTTTATSTPTTTTTKTSTTAVPSTTTIPIPASTTTDTTATAASTTTRNTGTPGVTTASVTTTTTTATTTTTTTPTTTVATTAAPVWRLSDASLKYLGYACDSTSGAVGLTEEGSLVRVHRVMCLSPPPEIAFTAPASSERCWVTLKECMTKTCPSNSIYIGTKGLITKYRPCSNGFSSSVATLDTSDCHVVEGDSQPRPSIASSSWNQWRYCKGNDTHFYVMTEALVTPASNTMDITSIKCCRVKPQQ